LDLGRDDLIMTVATDSAALYASEGEAYAARKYPDGFDEVDAGEAFGRHLEGIADDHVLELTHTGRKRIFNLGYYTWVEQQGVSVDDFERRKDQAFWQSLVEQSAAVNELIRKMNDDAGLNL
ncbi:MAG TPA: pyridoxal-5'-phosphate-dependent protein subunit beta, partial [Hyphomicrobiales bacterium]|nr:pyridoxal-5'-phosphate-dependent protein subunit beta [Hyphomicrobiales bacterium]